jgi:hypothetical protein
MPFLKYKNWSIVWRMQPDVRKILTVSTAIAALIWAGKAGAWDSGFNDRSCYVPPQISCNGCAIAVDQTKLRCADEG